MSTIFRNARVRVSTSTGEDDARDVSSSVTKVAASRDFDLVDLTTLTKTARFNIKGHESWAFDVGLLQAFSTEHGNESGERIDSLLDTLASITAAGNSFRVAVMPNRSLPRSETNPEYSGLCVLEEYNPLNGEVGDLLKVEPSFVGVGELTRDTSTEDDSAMDDTVSVSMSETASFVNELSVTDTINLMHSDVAAIIGSTIPKTASDTLAVQIDELTILTMTFPISGETIALSITETAVIGDTATSKSTTDSNVVVASETMTAHVSSSTAGDTVAVHLTESATKGILSDIAHVQSTSTSGSGGPGKSLAFSVNVTSGSLIVVATTSDQTISSVTDSQGNTYNVAEAYNAGGMAVYYAMNCAAGATTVTVTFSASTGYFSLSIHEYSGVALTSALDQVDFQQSLSVGAGADSFSSPSLVPAMTRSLFFGFGQVSYPLATQPGTNYTQRQEPFVNTITEDRVLVGTASTATVFGHSGGTAGSCEAVICIFKPKVT